MAKSSTKQAKVNTSTDISSNASNTNNTPVRHITNRQVNSILQLHLQGLSLRQIATQVKCGHQTVANCISKHKRLLQQIDNTKDLEPIKQQILSSATMMMIKSAMDKANDIRTSVKDLAFAADKFHNIQRLDAGLATKNVAHLIQFTSAPTDTDD